MARAVLFILIASMLVSCSSTNVLTYHKLKYYTENETYKRGSNDTLVQRINYNVPDIVDEEHSYELTFLFSDTLAAKNKRTLNLQTDTNIVKATYGVISVWNWSNSTHPVVGKITIQDWQTDFVTLKENIRTYNNRGQMKRFVGTRTFKLTTLA